VSTVAPLDFKPVGAERVTLKANVKIGDSPSGVRRGKARARRTTGNTSFREGGVLIPTAAIAIRILGEHTRVTTDAPARAAHDGVTI